MIRVLLVDDERLFARMMRRMLAVPTGPGSMTVDDCRTGRAALTRIADRRYDVALIDGVLADMSGIELGLQIRALGQELALILITGQLLEPAHELAAFAAGFDDYLRKPLDASMVRARITAVARRMSVAPARVASASREQLSWRALGDAAIEVRLDEPLAIVYSRAVELTPLKWRILRVLYAARGTIVERGRLIREAWGAAPPADADRALDKHVHELRAMLGDYDGELLETIRGLGFRLRFARNANTAE